MSKKIVFFDVDNTIVDRDNNCIPASTLAGIHTLKQNGTLVALATGRSLKMLQDENLLALADIIISSNGSLATYKGSVVYSNPIADDVLKKAVAAFGQEIAYVLHTPDKSVAFNRDRYVDEFLTILQVRLSPQAESLTAGEDIYQINAFFTEQYDYLKEQLPYLRFIPLKEMQYGYDVFAGDTGKGVAIHEVLTRLELSGYQTYCFGDGLNDLDMFAHVETGIAMGNAHSDLKARAHYVTSPVNQDGIYQALTFYRLI
ncbi:HAD-IIB family hydrolase [Sporomusa aerivorans]|uniref:HAD-IIB family hydrolase n=1 Tax=Sporomusa aerivorans TaxID=204936 RepID=UPI00352BC877